MEHLENSVENTINKMTDALAKELETLNDSELHDLFMFYYRINHQQRDCSEGRVLFIVYE